MWAANDNSITVDAGFGVDKLLIRPRNLKAF